MKIIFLFTGKTEDPWIEDGLGIYLKRLKHYCAYECKELPAPKNKGKLSRENVLASEALSILGQLEPSDKLILLDEGGKEMTSVEMSMWINKQQISGIKRMVLVIGGAYGFHESVYLRADQKVSLSKMTFTHQMVRVILVEQIYRAYSILKGEKYHHE